MAVSGNQLTRLGAYLFGVGRKLVITAKAAGSVELFGGAVISPIVVGNGLTSLISDAGDGLTSRILTDNGVISNISDAGNGLTSLIDDAGNGVESKIS